ncbi:MAG: hypothetical protein ACYS8Z_02845 [Planctomycetota bacterium]|jgi:hypothetical protein
MISRNRFATLLFVTTLIILSAASLSFAQERNWQILLDGIFRNGTKPLYLYARERDGQWIAVVGSSRDPEREGRKTYNKSWYYGDLSRVPITDGKVKGRFTLYVTPDLWVPRDHKPYEILFEIDAKLDSPDKLAGEYRIVKIGTDDVSTRDFGRSGKVTGTAKQDAQPDQPENVTYECRMQASLVGGDPKYGGRCMVLWLGIEDGKLTSTIHGLLSQKWEAYGKKNFAYKDNEVKADKNRITAHITVPTQTLDMEPCKYVFDIDGRILDEVLVGTYKLKVEIEGKPDTTFSASFDGEWYKGVTHLESDDRPWYAPVKGFEPPTPGEHPRLLFRKSDLPALRKKARTPEGKAILKRLRYLLDGKDGETMTTVFSNATHAYMGGGYKNSVVNDPGVYTIGHVAGYGLLYQLTGDTKYAEFGKQCFEKALAGVRDRDGRYSFKAPGGPLRAGPSVGWYAVGYDLCYDGWDPADREKFGRAIAEYSQASSGDKEKKSSDLEALARGTMPPASNHFGMQIGGASLALLAVTGEEWVDQDRIDTLLRIAEQSMIRNVSEGFGDGGFFAEGDGTGSMASQIAYLSAVAAWKNTAGKDFVNVERPNVQMLTLKWIYQTIVRNGRPDFWPIRGSYGQNVWSRQGVSGAGYFAIGLGAVTKDHQAAMKWYYNRFLGQTDAEAGTPYDTACRYPHVAVSAFVNWPLDVEEKNPARILPLCYRDTSCGFYAWRNRWKDENDTVITTLTNRTEGYMAAKPDKALRINSMGKHTRWGTLKEGPTKYWWASDNGRASSLTLADGTCFAIDFTAASGADTMLVTTGKAEGQSAKIGGKTLTFYFPTTQSPPKVTVRNNAATVGKQKITFKDGNLELAVTNK